MKNKVVGLVGGEGRMGRWFQTFFRQAGLEVLSCDINTSVTYGDIGKKCDIAIITVPIVKTVEVIEQVGPLMRPQALLMDFTSNKIEPLAAMMANSRCEVLGAHPLFGPREPSLEGRRVVLTPGRGEVWLPKILKLFEDYGAIVRVISAEKHDELMSAVQGLAHLSTLALALTILEKGLDTNDLDAFSTSSFKHLEPQIERTLRQDADLIGPILTLNPKVIETVKLWENQVLKLKKLVEGKDAEGCAAILRQAREYMGVAGEAAELKRILSERETR